MTHESGINSGDIEEVVTKAVALSDWLETQVASIKTGQVCIPPELTTLGMLSLTVGASLLLNGNTPDMVCWGSLGGCSL